MIRQSRISDQSSIENSPTLAAKRRDGLPPRIKLEDIVPNSEDEESTCEEEDDLPSTGIGSKCKPAEVEDETTTIQIEDPLRTRQETQQSNEEAVLPTAIVDSKHRPVGMGNEVPITTKTEVPCQTTRETRRDDEEPEYMLPTTTELQREPVTMESEISSTIETNEPLRTTQDTQREFPRPMLKFSLSESESSLQRKANISKTKRSSSAESAVIQTALGVKAHFKDYCSSTAIHGVRYFAERDRLRIEKIFWAVAITLLMAGCFNRISKAYKKWETSPVIVTFAEHPTSIWQVPFPAVSICSETKSRQTVFNFTDMFWRRQINDSSGNRPQLDHKELKKVDAVSLLCERQTFDLHREQVHPFEGAAFVDDEIMQDLRKLAPDVEFAMTLCHWRGKRVANCSDLFRPVWSDEGTCFTFNMLDNSELFTKTAVQYSELNTEFSSTWDLERGYHAEQHNKTYPYRTAYSGARVGLFIQLRANDSDFDYLCRGVQGFKVLLHNPAEVPLIGQQYFRVPRSQDVVAVVTPTMVTTSDGLYDYSPHRRQCYFPRERHLRFFQVYTQKNCELECLANLTLKQCGCVSFYMPRENTTAICGPGKKLCTQNALTNLISEDMRTDLGRRTEGEGTQTTECDCLASCVSLEYYAEISQADYNWKDDVFSECRRKNAGQAVTGLTLSRISIYYKEFQFTTIRRREMNGPVDFIANCGGLLNLFSGFSFISLIEILYFLTLRLWSRVEKWRRKRSVSQDGASYDL